MLLVNNELQAQGGGLVLYEVATPNIGNAYAGQSAVAHDASTAYLNPAAITEVEDGKNWLIGLEGIKSQINWVSDDPNQSSIDAGATSPSFGLYYVKRINDKWHIGATINAPIGFSFDYGDDWEGRYNTQNAFIAVVNVAPTVAYRFNDKLSAGLAVNLYGGLLKENIALKSVLSPGHPDDGTVTASGSSFSAGFQLGFHYRPAPGTSIGLMYRMKSNINFSGDADVDGYFLNNEKVESLPFKTDMLIPHGLNLGLSQYLNSSIELLIDFGWAAQSEFKSQPIYIGVNENEAAIDREFQNTFRIGVGGNYFLNEKYTFRAGYSYDSSPAKDVHTVDMPVGAAHRLGLGVNLQTKGKLNLGLNYCYMHSPSIPVSQSIPVSANNLNGTFDPVSLNTLAITFGF